MELVLDLSAYDEKTGLLNRRCNCLTPCLTLVKAAQIARSSDADPDVEEFER
jgi:hypothetical protein